jgi:hypothetical protein
MAKRKSTKDKQRSTKLSDWFFFMASDWLIGRKWRLLIGQISWLLIG